LLDAAWDEAVERGLEALTLAAVAAQAGVSRQAVYLHFHNRSTLLVEMTRRHDRTSGFVGRLVAARQHSPAVAFRRTLEEWYAYLPTILPIARSLEAAALNAADGTEAYLDRMRDWRESLRIVVAGLADAELLTDRWNIDTATDWVWSTVHPTTYHHLVSERRWQHADVVSTTIDTLEHELYRPNYDCRRRDAATTAATSRTDQTDPAHDDRVAASTPRQRGRGASGS
jgi:AcrR family transcriptional regulator